MHDPIMRHMKNHDNNLNICIVPIYSYDNFTFAIDK